MVLEVKKEERCRYLNEMRDVSGPLRTCPYCGSDKWSKFGFDLHIERKHPEHYPWGELL